MAYWRAEADIQEHEAKIEERQQAGKDAEYFASRVLLMGLERTKYLLSSYLHSRLAKIERFTVFFLTNEEARSRLSPSELDYATK